VVVLTSSDNPETKLKALQFGANDFLAKPVDASELALRLRNTLAARAYEQRMKFQDPLTQLPNRLLFTNRANAALEIARKQDNRSAAILVNINRFKLINDSLGPARGDDILWMLSQRLCQVFGILPDAGFKDGAGDHAYIARIGGDRFVIMVPIISGSTPQEEVDPYISTANVLRKRIDNFIAVMEKPFSVGGQDIYLNVYVGVSTLSADTQSVEHLINDAETAMIHATRRLNTKVAYYSEQMDEKAHELLSIENGLRTAVENNEIFVVYQPKVNVATGRITGSEALVRWMHPEFGLISPVEFYMAVNVSIRQLSEPNFTQIVSQVLQDSGLKAKNLVVEITENLIMENAESNIVKLGQLREIGVKLSIDDFGTGYSALNYLQRFSMDQLKIDQSFIRPIKSADEKQPIVSALIMLAHEMGMQVVAEGVETPQQLELISKLNCDEYQGYLCSRPIASNCFADMLIEQAQLKKSA